MKSTDVAKKMKAGDYSPSNREKGYLNDEKKKKGKESVYKPRNDKAEETDDMYIEKGNQRY
jgi:hypothetical protein